MDIKQYSFAILVYISALSDTIRVDSGVIQSNILCIFNLTLRSSIKKLSNYDKQLRDGYIIGDRINDCGDITSGEAELSDECR